MRTRFIIYKITNNINGRYYIGRHATTNINDSYMGSGIGIKNAVNKYGVENFTKEIIAESTSAENLWELEKQIVNDDIVNDKMSYNVAYGGKNYIDGLKRYDYQKFIEHQSSAGKSGGKSFIKTLDDRSKTEWHSSGGRKCAEINKQNKSHPFYNGTAASMGGKAIKGMIELWNPNSLATNKNQSCYNSGDCKRVKIGSEEYQFLTQNGWRTISDHKTYRKVLID